MLEELEYNPETHDLFAPNIEDVTITVEALLETLDQHVFSEMRVLDILLAVEAVADHLKTSLGVAGLTAVVDEEEVADE